MTELWRMGAVDIASAVGNGDVSARQVMEAHLERIGSVGAAVNAVVVTLADEALAAADAADRRLAEGEAPRPLEGVPFTVKENIDVSGSATTQGVVAFAGAVAPLDAPSVAHLRASGGIPIGRTNMPDFAMRLHTDNALRGQTLNPWDPSITAGGSSGGDAVAVATGTTPLGLGTDVGGSLRWPAQCVGVATLRTGMGRVARAAAVGTGSEPFGIRVMNSVGPVARHVRDLRAAFRIMIQPSSRDPWHVAGPLEGPATGSPMRVAVVVDPGGAGVSADVAAGVERAAGALEDAGHVVEEAEPPAIGRAAELWGQLLSHDLREAWPMLRPLVSDGAARFASLLLDAIPAPSGPAYAAAFVERREIIGHWAAFMERFPVVVGPVATVSPFVVGEDLDPGRWGALFPAFRLVVAVNALGLPAVALPVGLAAGVPQAVQVIGRPHREDICLDVAESLEERLGAVTPIQPAVSDAPATSADAG
jgi:amidase